MLRLAIKDLTGNKILSIIAGLKTTAKDPKQKHKDTPDDKLGGLKGVGRGAAVHVTDPPSYIVN
jgi:hypothetical protein